MDTVENWLSGFYDLNPDAIVEEVVKKKKEVLIPLNDELLAMDLGNKEFYNKLTDEQKKEISIWVLMRFMSSAQGSADHHLMMVNDLVNHHFNSITKHPELQWKLLSICGTGKKQYHPWIAPPKGFKKNRVEQTILEYFPLLNDDELALMIQINTKQDLEKFFIDNGLDDKTIKDIFKNDTKS